MLHLSRRSEGFWVAGLASWEDPARLELHWGSSALLIFPLGDRPRGDTLALADFRLVLGIRPVHGLIGPLYRFPLAALTAAPRMIVRIRRVGHGVGLHYWVCSVGHTGALSSCDGSFCCLLPMPFLASHKPTSSRYAQLLPFCGTTSH